VTKAAGLSPVACFTGLWNYRTMTKYYRQNRYLVFKNRQDQVYMSFHMIPFLSSSISTQDTRARNSWAALSTSELAEVRWAMEPLDPQVDGRVDGSGPLQDNLHGIWVDYLWDVLPPEAIRANKCGTSAPTTFRDLLTRFWNDSSPATSSERYCSEGDWVTWPAPK
jgi:hypothetical protein